MYGASGPFKSTAKLIFLNLESVSSRAEPDVELGTGSETFFAAASKLFFETDLIKTEDEKRGATMTSSLRFRQKWPTCGQYYKTKTNGTPQDIKLNSKAN